MSNTIAKRKCLQRQTREIIAKVYEFLKKDAEEIINIAIDPECTTRQAMITYISDHVNCARKRTAKAVGVSERTITNILAEKRQPGSNFKSPYKNRKKRPTKLELDDSNVKVIRTTIDNYYLEHQKLPTLLKLKRIFQEKLNYEGSLSTLRSVLIKLGYNWGKNKKNGKSVE